MEKVIHFLTRIGYSNFKIKDAQGKQIAYSINDNIEDAIADFRKEYADLDTGKTYRIIVGKISNFQETKSEYLDFKKGAATSKNTMDADFIAKLTQDAYERGMKDAEIKLLRQEVQSVKDELKELKSALRVKFDELEGVNDKDFMSKAEDAASAVSAFQNLFSGSGINIPD